MLIVSSLENKDGFMVINLISTLVRGKKKKDSTKLAGRIKCKDGNFYLDGLDYVPSNNKEIEGSIEFAFEGDYIKFPNQMQSGDKLEDAVFTVSVGASGSSITALHVNIFDRQVEKQGSFSTKAGDFDGAVISYGYDTKIAFIKVRGRVKQWYVPGIGVVKSESYNKKGKLRESFELVSISN